MRSTRRKSLRGTSGLRIESCGFPVRSMNGVEAITAVVEHLQLPDLELLLSNRGLPSIGTKDELKGRLHAALKEQFCPYEWERGAVPEYHAGRAPTMFFNCAMCVGFIRRSHWCCAFEEWVSGVCQVGG